MMLILFQMEKSEFWIVRKIVGLLVQEGDHRLPVFTYVMQVVRREIYGNTPKVASNMCIFIFTSKQTSNFPPFKSPKSFRYLENKLLFISINFTPKTSHSCLKKLYFPRFSRYLKIGGLFLSLIYGCFGGGLSLTPKSPASPPVTTAPGEPFGAHGSQEHLGNEPGSENGPRKRTTKIRTSTRALKIG